MIMGLFILEKENNTIKEYNCKKKRIFAFCKRTFDILSS
jgi:hypothetical protein